MWCDHIPPSRLMYETAAVLSVRTSTCLPNISGRNCRKAKCTAHNSRQLMCQSSRGPVQSPEAACPLLVAPQPVLDASVVTTVCRDTCSRGGLDVRCSGLPGKSLCRHDITRSDRQIGKPCCALF